MSKTKKILMVLWIVILILIIGVGIFYFTQKNSIKNETTEKTTTKETKSDNNLYEDLLDMDYQVINVTEEGSNLFLTLQGDFTKEDILSYSNKLLNLVKEKDLITVYYFDENSADCKYKDFETEDMVAYTVTDFKTKELSYNTYENVSVTNLETLNDYDENSIKTVDNRLFVTIDMQNLNVEDLNEIASQAKTFSDLFINTNSEKSIENLHVILNSVDANQESTGYVFNYETKYLDTLLVSELKTFSKK